MQYTIDFAQIMLVAFSALVGVVWNNLNEKIKSEADKTRSGLVSHNEILRARVDTLEKDLGTIPMKIDQLTKQIQTLELNLNSQFATKSEVNTNNHKLDEFLKHALEIVRQGKER